jgi:acylglycerol lipase
MIIQGGLDKLVNPDGAFELYYQSKTKEEDKEILFYEKMWHDVWHEEEIHEINKKVVEWIKIRVSKFKEAKNQGFE